MVAAGRTPRPEALVADDDAISREILQTCLESVGCEVLAAESGSEALTVYEANADRIGLLILDACMPGPAPRQLYQLIRRLSPSVPVLFCSAFPSDDPALSFVGEHGLRLLKKPFERAAFFEAAAEVLKAANTELSAAIVPCVELGSRCPACGGTSCGSTGNSSESTRVRRRDTGEAAPAVCPECGAEIAGPPRSRAADRADVLIADDESVHRRILEFYLGSFGCRVHAASDGHEVLAACRDGAEGIKLVVLDVRMPGPSPIRLYQRIREVRPELAVLFCSGGSPDDPEICSINELGLQFLPKPFRRSDLKQAIEKVLSQPGPAGRPCAVHAI